MLSERIWNISSDEDTNCTRSPDMVSALGYSKETIFTDAFQFACGEDMTAMLSVSRAAQGVELQKKKLWKHSARASSDRNWINWQYMYIFM